MRRDYYVAFCLVNVFALFGLLGGIWLHARQPAGGDTGRARRMPRWKRGEDVVFDEPLVNYVVGLKRLTTEKDNQGRPKKEVVESSKSTPQSFPRVFEQRDILVDDHPHSSAKINTLKRNGSSEPDNVTTATPHHDYLKPTDKVDFVIPWINYSMGYTESKTTPFNFGAPLYNIVSKVGLKRPPWTEICWSVRSILYHGGPSVGTIYIVYNAHRHPAPACDFQNSQVVSMPQQKFLEHTVLDHPNMSSPRPHAVLQFVHQIKDLRNFFIFSMDDIFLLQRFQVTDFYDFTHQKILTHMTAGRSGISPGTAYGASELEKYFKRRVEHGDGLHVPFMVRKKSQERLTEALAHLFSHCPPPVHLCDFGTHYQSLVQNFMILEGVAENRAPSQFSEIHTTSSTRLYQALTQSRATWLDVQGTGVSDEYGGDEANRIRIREEFDRWLQEQAFYRNVKQRTREGTHDHRHHKPPCTTLQDLHTVAAACAQQYHPPGPDALCHANHPLHHHAWLHRITSDLTLPTTSMARACPVLSFPSTPQRFASIEFKCYSQNTEDGILLAIFAAIGTTNKRAVEIAGGLGWENNAINLVVNFGFDALFFDGDPGNTRCAKNFLRQHEATRDRVDRGVWWSSDFVTRENINALIYNTTQWEGEIDLFSLDMDGVDWWIWDALVVVRPRVVVVEIQELWGPDEIKTRPYRADHVSPEIAAMGASLGAFAWLAAQKGYRLVGCIKQGFNAFFVREDVPGVDAVFGRGEYARAGCFAHVDDAWRGVLEGRRQRAGRYDWVDPRDVRGLGEGVGHGSKKQEFNIADTMIAKTMQRYRNMSFLHAVTELIHPSQTQKHDLAILVLTCNRQTSLEALLDTLSNAQGIRDRPVYVSIDCNPGPILNTTQWSTRGLNLQPIDSHQRHVVETGAAKARKDERVTRHWLHAVTTALRKHEHVLYLEDDHLVHPAILHDADVLLSAQPDLCPSCFAVQLGCHRDCWGMASTVTTASDVARMEPGNMGVVYSRTTWKWFLQYLDTFCSIYGTLDVILHHVLSVHAEHQHALTFLKSRVVHNSGCDSNRNTGELVECNDALLQRDRARLVIQDMAMDPVLSDRGTAKMPDMTIDNTNAIQADADTRTQCIHSTENGTTLSKKQKLIYCFPYNGEKKMAMERAKSKAVAFFIVSESSFAVDGTPKQLSWQKDFESMYVATRPEISQAFASLKYIPVLENYFEDETEEGRWKQEVTVRAILGTGVKSLYEKKLIDDNDIVIVTDADEVINDATLQYIRSNLKHEEYAEVSLSWYLYNKCWLHTKKWTQPVAVTVNTLRERFAWNTHFIRAIHNPQVVKNQLKKMKIPTQIHGYHCSWCFAKSDFRRKITTALEIPTSIRNQKYSDMKIDMMWRNGINWQGDIHGEKVCDIDEFERELCAHL